MPIENQNEIPINDIICNIENSIQGISPQNRDNIRAKCTNILTNYKNKFNPKNCNQYNKVLLKQMKNTKTFLKQHPELKILNPDKTNKTVIMYTND